MGSKERYAQGRQARLRAEVFAGIQDIPVKYSCIYLRVEQANQFKRGWNSVTAIDIDVAIKQVRAGKAKLEPRTKLAVNVAGH